MLKDRFLRRLFLLVFLFAVFTPALFRGLAHVNPLDPLTSFPAVDPRQRITATDAETRGNAVADISIPQDRRKHILYGDKNGGGHLHGMGKPCKSEFPEDWDAEEIIANVRTIAANDNLSWKEQRNGYAVAEANVDGVRIRVVIDPDHHKVITAYPVNTPRNPCPAAANDNTP